MYAILFDLDFSICKEVNIDNAHKLIRNFMRENGFYKSQNNLYFGNEDVNSVTCVITIQRMAKKYTWFATCVKDIRMLRIEDNNSLYPAL